MHGCLPLEKLLDFATGRLSPSEHRTLRGHVQDCPACQARVTRFEQIIDFIGHYEPAASTHIPSRLRKRLLSMIPVPSDRKTMRSRLEMPVGARKIRQVVAQWIGPAVSPPLLARTQGAVERGRTHLYRAEDVEIALALKPRGGDRWAILGDILSAEVSDEVTLRALDGDAQWAVSAEGSAFLFDTVERGIYTLQIPCGDRWIEIESLKIGMD